MVTRMLKPQMNVDLYNFFPTPTPGFLPPSFVVVEKVSPYSVLAMSFSVAPGVGLVVVCLVLGSVLVVVCVLPGVGLVVCLVSGVGLVGVCCFFLMV